MALALAGIKVVDVSQVAAVPMCARHLADFGADVIHVEHPVRGDSWRVFQSGQGTGTYGTQSNINYNWETFNRNKRSLALDLSQEGGREIVHKLLGKTDVFMTNLRQFERQQFGLEYDTLRQLYPKLIYGSLTGYGKKGPEIDNPAYDTNAYWARSGIPHRLTTSGVRPTYTPAFGDTVAALALAFGIMTALFVRDRTGTGQEVDTSLFHTGIYQNSFDIAGALVTGQDCDEWKRLHREDNPNPLSEAYLTKDGRAIMFTILQPDRWWSRVCRAIGREDLEHDSRFNSLQARKEHNAALIHILDEVLATRTLAEWKPILARIPCAPVQNYTEVINDPQARANEFFIPFDHPTYGRIDIVANPVKLSQTPATMRMPAPEFSQHTEEILLEQGYTWEDIDRFKQQRIIA